MQPVHDLDAVLLMAITLSSKRRPAELAEIMAAADLIQGSLPAESKLCEAFAKLSSHGLICAADSGYTLTPNALKIMTTLPRKGENEARIRVAREKLTAYLSKGEHPPLVIAAEQFKAAIAAHRASGLGAGKNMLVPKPKAPESDLKRPGQRQRKPLATRRKKD